VDEQILLLRGTRASGRAELLDAKTCAVLATVDLPDARDIVLSFWGWPGTSDEGIDYEMDADAWNDSVLDDELWPQTEVCAT
jgi:hypothetical protein